MSKVTAVKANGRRAKKNIIQVAREFFSEYGYLGASMSDLATRLNMTKAGLYYHFAGKAEIFKTVLDEAFAELSQGLTEAKNAKTAHQKLENVIKSYLQFRAREKNLTKVLVLKLTPRDTKIMDHIVELRRQMLDLIQPVIDEVLTSKKINKPVDSRTYTLLLTGMMDGLLLEYSIFRQKVEPDEIVRTVMAAMF